MLSSEDFLARILYKEIGCSRQWETTRKVLGVILCLWVYGDAYICIDICLYTHTHRGKGGLCLTHAHWASCEHYGHRCWVIHMDCLTVVCSEGEQEHHSQMLIALLSRQGKSRDSRPKNVPSAQASSQGTAPCAPRQLAEVLFPVPASPLSTWSQCERGGERN